MSGVAEQVAQWKRDRKEELIQCRRASTLTRDACRLFQSRIARRSSIRYDGGPPTRLLREEYLHCACGAPCPHFLGDAEAEALRERRERDSRRNRRERLTRAHRVRELERLTNPDLMLAEGPWKRSLVAR
jgi:hypothetical protein